MFFSRNSLALLAGAAVTVNADVRFYSSCDGNLKPTGLVSTLKVGDYSLEDLKTYFGDNNIKAVEVDNEFSVTMFGPNGKSLHVRDTSCFQDEFFQSSIVDNMLVGYYGSGCPTSGGTGTGGNGGLFEEILELEPRPEGEKPEKPEKPAEKPKPKNGCDNPDYLMCIDFEGKSKGDFPGFSFGNLVDIDNGVGHGAGKSSLKFYSDNKQGANNYGKGYMKKNTPTETTHWGRAFIKIKGMNNGFMHTSFVAADNGDGEVRVVDTVKADNGGIQFLYNFADDNMGKGSSYNYGGFDDGNWECVEWHVDKGNNQLFEFFLNGQRNDEISYNTQRRMPQSYSYMAFGAQVYQNDRGQNAEGWMDDIVISKKRVGCDPLN
eukprot:Pgem_evm1s17007